MVFFPYMSDIGENMHNLILKVKTLVFFQRIWNHLVDDLFILTFKRKLYTKLVPALNIILFAVSSFIS